MNRVNIQGYDFEGPWTLGQGFNDVPGIYAVYIDLIWLDVGETDSLGSRINGDSHERKPDWIRNANGRQINIAFLRVSDSNKRLEIESNLRSVLNPCCGER